MTNHELVREFRYRLDAIWNAYNDYLFANSARSADVMVMWQAVEKRKLEAFQAIDARLSGLADVHAALADAIRAWEELPSPSAAGAEQFYNRLPICIRGLQIKVETRLLATTPPDDREESETPLDTVAMLTSMGDENTLKVIQIAHNQELSTEEKVVSLYELDSRFLGYIADRIGGMLQPKVTGSRIRQLHAWTVTRKEMLKDHR